METKGLKGVEKEVMEGDEGRREDGRSGPGGEGGEGDGRKKWRRGRCGLQFGRGVVKEWSV